MHNDTRWRKSIRSNTNGACVEIAESADAVSVRDSKDPTGPALTFTPESFSAFVATLKQR